MELESRTGSEIESLLGDSSSRAKQAGQKPALPTPRYWTKLFFPEKRYRSLISAYNRAHANIEDADTSGLGDKDGYRLRKAFNEALDYTHITSKLSYPFRFIMKDEEPVSDEDSSDNANSSGSTSGWQKILGYFQEACEELENKRLIYNDLGLGWLLSWIPGTKAFQARLNYANSVAVLELIIEREIRAERYKFKNTSEAHTTQRHQYGLIYHTMFPSGYRFIGVVLGLLVSISTILLSIGGLVVAGVVPEVLASTAFAQFLATVFTGLVSISPFGVAALSVTTLAVALGMGVWLTALMLREIMNPHKSRIMRAVHEYWDRVTRVRSLGNSWLELVAFPFTGLLFKGIKLPKYKESRYTNLNIFRFLIHLLRKINNALNSLVDIGEIRPDSAYATTANSSKIRMFIKALISLPFILAEQPLHLLKPIGDLLPWTLIKASNFAGFAMMCVVDVVVIIEELVSLAAKWVYGLIKDTFRNGGIGSYIVGTLLAVTIGLTALVLDVATSLLAFVTILIQSLLAGPANLHATVNFVSDPTKYAHGVAKDYPNLKGAELLKQMIMPGHIRNENNQVFKDMTEGYSSVHDNAKFYGIEIAAPAKPIANPVMRASSTEHAQGVDDTHDFGGAAGASLQ